MSGKFHDELKELKCDLLVMANLAKEMLHKSVKALKTQDAELAEKIISRKYELAELDAKIEAEAFVLLTLHQPMAKDLRTLACALKMITYLNRIGRYGKDIALLAKDMTDKPHIAKLVSLPQMEKMVESMIDDALKAYENWDTSPLEDFKERDDEVDAMRYSIFRECLTYMMEDQKNITRCINYIIIARYLERCADHASKMAEKIHYMVTGEHIDIDDKIPDHREDEIYSRE
jgi:phosphate transport system protein